MLLAKTDPAAAEYFAVPPPKLYEVKHSGKKLQLQVGSTRLELLSPRYFAVAAGLPFAQSASCKLNHVSMTNTLSSSRRGGSPSSAGGAAVEPVASYAFESICEWGEVKGDLRLVLDDGEQVSAGEYCFPEILL